MNKYKTYWPRKKDRGAPNSQFSQLKTGLVNEDTGRPLLPQNYKKPIVKGFFISINGEEIRQA